MAEENAHSSRFTRAEGSRGLKRILLQKDKLAVFCCFYCRCSFSFWLEIVAFSQCHSLLFCFAFSFCSFYSCCCCCCVCQSFVAFVSGVLKARVWKLDSGVVLALLITEFHFHSSSSFVCRIALWPEAGRVSDCGQSSLSLPLPLPCALLWLVDLLWAN